MIGEPLSQFGNPGTSKAFSCASHPGEKEFIEITVKDSRSIPELKPGDPVEFTGPIGNLTLPDSIPEGVAGAVHVAAGSLMFVRTKFTLLCQIF